MRGGGAAFLTERRGGHCCMHLVGVMEGGMEGGGGPLLYAFGESYGERVGWRRGAT